VKVDHRPPNSVDIATAEGEPKTAAVARLAAFGGRALSRAEKAYMDGFLRWLEAQMRGECPVNTAGQVRRARLAAASATIS